jgi:hypothetical protein
MAVRTHSSLLVREVVFLPAGSVAALAAAPGLVLVSVSEKEEHEGRRKLLLPPSPPLAPLLPVPLWEAAPASVLLRRGAVPPTEAGTSTKQPPGKTPRSTLMKTLGVSVYYAMRRSA